MKLNRAISGLILLHLSAASSAAETNTRNAEPPPAFTWRGFHVGVNFGGGFGDLWNAPGFRTGHELGPDSWWSASLAGTNGLLGGVQAGYDYAFGPLVIGVEADWQAAGLNASAHTVGTGEPLTLLSAKQAIDWFGTLRGRVGLAVAPRLLIYATGGLAYGGGAKLFGYRDAEEREAEALKDPVSLGYSAGGGVEWAFLPDWSARLEYLYVNLGRSAGQVARLESKEETEEPSLPAFATLANGPQRFHTIRAGVNYRFNFIGNAAWIHARSATRWSSWVKTSSGVL
jgi:outer membrane immunogenic protein